MALRVLDGNQSATTLSSVVTGGEHIVAHSVVSLGTTAISNISTAVSGVNNAIGTDGGNSTSTKFIKIGGHQDGSNQVEHIVHVSAGGAMKVDASDSSVTFGLASVTFSAVSISNFPSTQTIAGTVTANVLGYSDNETSYQPIPVVPWDESVTSGRAVVVKVEQTGAGAIPISGTVTANIGNYYSAVTVSGANAGLAGGLAGTTVTVFPVSIVNSKGTGGGDLQGYNGTRSYLNVGIQNIGNTSLASESSLPISGTVTVSQLPRVTFIDGSGSVTTANSAITVFASSTTRSYLLVQVTTGSAFVNVGATATTLNGISLTAGQGYAWETTIPQGAVSLISTTTSSRYVAKEA